MAYKIFYANGSDETVKAVDLNVLAEFIIFYRRSDPGSYANVPLLVVRAGQVARIEKVRKGKKTDGEA